MKAEILVTEFEFKSPLLAAIFLEKEDFISFQD